MPSVFREQVFSTADSGDVTAFAVVDEDVGVFRPFAEAPTEVGISKECFPPAERPCKVTRNKFVY